MQKVSGWCSFLHHLNGNLEPTWNSKWGKAALSWAALLRLEVPTWFYNFRWLLHVSYKGNFLHVFLTTAPLWRLLRQSAVLPFFRTTASRGSLGEQATWTQVLSLKCFFQCSRFIFSSPPYSRPIDASQSWVAAKSNLTCLSRTAPMTIPGGSDVGKSFMLCTTKSTWAPDFLIAIKILLNGVTTRLSNSDQNPFELTTWPASKATSSSLVKRDFSPILESALSNTLSPNVDIW